MTPNPQSYRLIQNIHRIGLFAELPAIGEVLPGTLFYATDTGSLLRAGTTGWEVYSSAGSGGGGVSPHHASHEPGGSDALVGAAWVDLINTFTKRQFIGPGDNTFLNIRDDSGEGARLILQDLTAPTELQLSMIRFIGGGLGFQILDSVGAAVSSWAFSAGQLIIRAPTGFQASFSFNGLSDIQGSPKLQSKSTNELELLRYDNAGRNILLAAGFGDTPLNASQLLSGSVPNARLSIDVLKHTGGYPGGSTVFLRGDGTFVAPPATPLSAHAPTHNTGGTDPITAISGDIITTGTVADARHSANVALKNINNNFTVPQSITSAVTVAGPNSVVSLRGDSSPANARTWRMVQFGDASGDFHLEAMNDAGVAQIRITFNRNGNVNVWGNIYERSRTVALGQTQTFAYTSSNVWGSNSSAVPNANTNTFTYAVIGDRIYCSFFISLTVGAGNTVIYIHTPGGLYYASKPGYESSTITLYDSVAGYVNGRATIAQGSNAIMFTRGVQVIATGAVEISGQFNFAFTPF